MSVGYAVSPHRYTILEEFGCVFSICDSNLGVGLIFGPQLLISLASLVYASKSKFVTTIPHISCFFKGLAARNIIRLRTSLSAHLSSTNTSITKSRFIRLLLLCLIMGIWPICAVSAILSHSVSNAQPWPGWKAVHSSFRHIPTRSTAEQSHSERHMEMTGFWVHAISAYLCFALLTTGEDVRKDFRDAWAFLRQNILRQRRSSATYYSSDESSRHTALTFTTDPPVIIIEKSTSDSYLGSQISNR